MPVVSRWCESCMEPVCTSPGLLRITGGVGEAWCVPGDVHAVVIHLL